MVCTGAKSERQAKKAVKKRREMVWRNLFILSP
jgi:TATA-box binding protein (TBP) (component of TFIID and TFIIIB)